ncbi:MAG TPA: malto-oligosyltrehalose trehalohydrolase [Xanthobacteraceae bacterium]|nr:malto-oligosyltrehalose trehalohydrolase [Xanthobacteraceae bacterium]
MSRGRTFGPRLTPEGGTEFRLWAPAARSVDLLTRGRTLPMQAGADGWFTLVMPDTGPGTRYKFRIDGELEVPDPASSFQPDDVPGASEVIDHRYPWRAESWRGRPWHEAAILELHVGTFTHGGTFRSAIEELDAVVECGFTAIELMPIADFAGRWNWGYDGVLWYAPDSVYGRPDDLMALIDAAHERGLMVFLDVVYNHFGPEGNFLARYAPTFFNADVHTPWGAAIDYTVPQVRAFAVENALHWLADYRFDGLRFDAVHAITQRGTPSILEEISRAVGELARESGRHIHLVLENDDNEAALLDPLADPPQGKFRAQWNDDYHHAWHVLLTGEKHGYYRDYAQAWLGHITRILSSGFAYQGQASLHRDSRPRGESSEHLPPTAFVSFLQNHDQTGNRARGERLEQLAPAPAIEAALAVMLLAPMPPLMFMGEEWGEIRPFPFFCDFKGDLANAVREGRRREFPHETAEGTPGLPDPNSELTFESAVLDRTVLGRPVHAKRRELVRRLLHCRREHVTPRLASLDRWRAEASHEGRLLHARWQLGGGTLGLAANLSDEEVPAPPARGEPVWGGAQLDTMPAWAVYWTWED